MARSLVNRAEERAKWIGDDHGDPYEAALKTGVVSDQMQIALKETLDHLRSALDYSAREICEQVGVVPAGAAVYFPIVARDFKPTDFKSRIGKLMPGVLTNRPDMEAVLASFQYFSDSENWWLPDLATLANATKHEQLSVNAVSTVDVRYEFDEAGELSITLPEGRTVVPTSLTMIIGLPPDFNFESNVDAQLKYLGLPAIDQELWTFLNAAIPGTRRIIDSLETAI